MYGSRCKKDQSKPSATYRPPQWATFVDENAYSSFSAKSAAKVDRHVDWRLTVVVIEGVKHDQGAGQSCPILRSRHQSYFTSVMPWRANASMPARLRIKGPRGEWKSTIVRCGIGCKNFIPHSSTFPFCNMSTTTGSGPTPKWSNKANLRSSAKR